ncbi:MAG: hypothetical protein ACT6FG_00105 [Methanosarcinaceae archaeon]
MSDYHIREIGDKSANVIYHIPVDGDNDAKVSWRDIVKKEKSVIGEPGVISGKIYEVEATVKFSSTKLTDAQRIAEIERGFSKHKLPISHRLYGYEGDVK